MILNNITLKDHFKRNIISDVKKTLLGNQSRYLAADSTVLSSLSSGNVSFVQTQTTSFVPYAICGLAICSDDTVPNS